MLLQKCHPCFTGLPPDWCGRLLPEGLSLTSAIFYLWCPSTTVLSNISLHVHHDLQRINRTNNDPPMASTARQSESNVSFDTFCEALRSGCRVVRWLGKPHPPEKTDYHQLHYSEKCSNGRYEFQLSQHCLLCQQLHRLVPEEEDVEHVRVHLDQVIDEMTLRSGEETRKGMLYDMLIVSIDIGYMIVDFRFGMLYSDGRSDSASPIVIIDSEKDPERARMEVRALTTNGVDYGMIRSWLDACEDHHKRTCLSVETVRVPGFRVIDCLSKTVIHPTEQDLKYAALSYVWGAAPSKQIHYLCFPKTIEDSITVTLALGLRYLWVDRYVSRLSMSNMCKDRY